MHHTITISFHTHKTRNSLVETCDKLVNDGFEIVAVIPVSQNDTWNHREVTILYRERMR